MSRGSGPSYQFPRQVHHIGPLASIAMKPQRYDREYLKQRSGQV